MRTDKQSGSSIAIIIIIIGIVALLGYIGYRVYSAHNNKSAVTTSSPAQTHSTQTTATYMDIKELGVKIKLSESIKDAVYSVVPTTDGSKGVGISAQSLVNKSATTCSPSNFTFGLLEAITDSTYLTAPNTPIKADNKSIIQLGNTYYWYRPPQNQTCLTDSQADSGIVASKINAFSQAFVTIQLDH